MRIREERERERERADEAMLSWHEMDCKQGMCCWGGLLKMIVEDAR